ncbi:MAG: hypothetical protein PWP23_2622 [Candidatus Sumerlaeota bacterium]|nr:hypothetical protein [Candidatus Sumerlaeota bacterium]
MIRARLNTAKSFHFLLIMLILAPLAARAQQKIPWVPDLPKAVEYARQTQKPLFVYVYTRHAEGCKQFQEQTLTNPAVIQLLANDFVCVPVDAETDRIVTGRFGVYRAPTVLILDPTGREFMRLVTYYPPGRLIGALQQLNVYAPQAPVPPSTDVPNVIFHESFDSLFGWGNEGSAAGCSVRLALANGVRGNAFRVLYDIEPKGWSWVQVYRELGPREQFILPPEYTIVFQLAGKGAHNEMNIKLLDQDGTNFGAIFVVPVDFQGHQYAITSDKIGYLWGGADKVLGKVYQIHIAVTPDQEYWETHGPEPSGEIYIDELYIIPGLRYDIPSVEISDKVE